MRGAGKIEVTNTLIINYQTVKINRANRVKLWTKTTFQFKEPF